MKIYKFLMLCIIVIMSACGGGGSIEPVKAPSKRVVVYYGDSLVNHSGDRLRFILGIPVQNYGKDAQMTYHAITGVYGSIDWSSDALYVFSWGTNEALQNISPDQFRLDLNHVVSTAKSLGKPVVIESPIRGQFVDVISEISQLYNVPISSYTPSESEFIWDGVHLNGEGLNNRAKILAAVVLKELTK